MPYPLSGIWLEPILSYNRPITLKVLLQTMQELFREEAVSWFSFYMACTVTRSQLHWKIVAASWLWCCEKRGGIWNQKWLWERQDQFKTMPGRLQVQRQRAQNQTYRAEAQSQVKQAASESQEIKIHSGEASAEETDETIRQRERISGADL